MLKFYINLIDIQFCYRYYLLITSIDIVSVLFDKIQISYDEFVIPPTIWLSDTQCSLHWKYDCQIHSVHYIDNMNVRYPVFITLTIWLSDTQCSLHWQYDCQIPSVHYIDNMTVRYSVHYIDNMTVRHSVHYIDNMTVRYPVFITLTIWLSDTQCSFHRQYDCQIPSVHYIDIFL